MMDLFRFAKLYGLELKIEYNNFDEIVVKFTTEYGNEYIRRIQSYELDSEESKMKMQQLICDWCTEELRLNRKLLKLVNNEKVKKEDINFFLLERGLELNGYGLDFTDFPEKTLGDWDNTFHNQLDEAIEQNREELEEEHGKKHLRELERQYKNEKLDIEKYNEYQEKIFGGWDEWLTAEYEKWDKEYDHKNEYIDEYIKYALKIIAELPDVDYKIVFNKEYRDVPFYLVAVGVKATKENCKLFVVKSYDIDDVYYEYADETEDISISLGDGWDHTASISYPY